MKSSPLSTGSTLMWRNFGRSGPTENRVRARAVTMHRLRSRSSLTKTSETSFPQRTTRHFRHHFWSCSNGQRNHATSRRATTVRYSTINATGRMRGHKEPTQRRTGRHQRHKIRHPIQEGRSHSRTTRLAPSNISRQTSFPAGFSERLRKLSEYFTI